jgi:glucose/arabinose dehydrogenase
MKKIIPALGMLALVAGCARNASVKQTDDTTEVRKIYSQFCSSCHGEKVEAFVDRQWRHGKSHEEIVYSITNGWLDNGMPAWKGSISDENISKLAKLIENSLETVDQYDFKEVARTDTYKSGNMTLKTEPVLEGLSSPWGLVSLPDGSLLVTDRAGDLWKVSPDKSKVKISGVPATLAEGQGGFFDLKLHPKYNENGWIYLTYAKFKKDDGKTLSTTAMIRGKLDGNTLVQQQELFEALPYFTTRHHYGARMAFDKDGYLYVSVGDRGFEKQNPQQLNNHCGKVHRLKDDGSIPSDNPFFTTPDAVKSIWSYGHRNPQGLIYKPDVNQIWEHEHGPRGGDEVNIIEKGKNYGWPVISYGINYNGVPITDISKKEGMEQPQTYYLPSIAPSGMAFITSDKYPAWKGDILLGSLRFQYADRLNIKNNKISSQTKELVNLGRMRNIFEAADGYIYIGIEGPGTVFRLLPL